LWLRKIIEQCGAPLYSTSVNRSGSPVLETSAEIKNEFEKEVAAIIDDGDKKGSLPSTLILLEKEGFKVLRQGAVIVEN
ncbi:MAG: Sua5/YciO/YrdC/YwlC family protein, partial [Spirochaetia bacterium]|nr:Sua5/YciO/YrdC/YwlC family protein [Spirochaetia bacterium]